MKFLPISCYFIIELDGSHKRARTYRFELILCFIVIRNFFYSQKIGSNNFSCILKRVLAVQCVCFILFVGTTELNFLPVRFLSSSMNGDKKLNRIYILETWYYLGWSVRSLNVCESEQGGNEKWTYFFWRSWILSAAEHWWKLFWYVGWVYWCL